MLNFIALCLGHFHVFCHDRAPQVSLPLAATLDSLKTAILRCPALRARAPASSGPRTIPEMCGLGIKSQMRLFHLGRELKSSGRSLSALGIGRFDNYLVHMASGGVADGNGSGGASSGRKRKAVGASGSGSGSGGGTTVEIDSSDDDDDEVIELDDSQESSAGGKTPAAASAASSSSGNGGGGGGPGEVIDLLDDSDDDDDAGGGAGGTSGAAAGKRQRA